MKPDFALSLSFDGITLLRRVKGGWSAVDEVPLDADDLFGALKDLRAQADSLSPKGGQVKLVVPNEQIKYLSLAAPRQDSALHSAIEAALEGATPYSVGDLVYDWTRKGDTLLVAAVARDTLQEAQDFTQSHHFEPVSYVAVAPPGKFDGEVFFGPAPSWSGPTPERDRAAIVRVVAPKAPPEIAPEAAPESGPEIAPKAEEPKVTGRMETDEAETGQAETAGAISKPPAEPEPAPDPELKPNADSEPEPRNGLPESAQPRPAFEPDPAPAPLTASKVETSGKGNAPEITTDDTPPPAFASIRATRGAPAAGQGARVAPPIPKAERSRITPLAADAATDQSEAQNSAAGEKAREKQSTGTEAPKPIPPRLAAIKAADRASVPPAHPPADLAESLSREALDAQDAAAEAPQSAASARASAPAAPAPAKRGRFRFGKAGKPRAPAKPGQAAKPDKPPSAPVAGAAAAALDERDRMTIFGARQGNDRVGGKPRFLGLILTTALLLFLAGMAAWASVFLDDGLARFFRDDVNPRVTVTESTLPETSVADEMAADAPEEMAALDPAQEAPEPAAPVNTAPERERPRALTPQEAEATYAATGIWQRAPSAPMEPQQNGIGGLYVASIDPGVQQFDAVALPETAPAAGPGFASPPNPAPAGVTYDLDPRGLVRAVPEGAMNPDGVLIYSGLPPAVPPLRGIAPQAAPEDTPESRAIQDRIERLRPELRPDDIVERNERATLSGRSLAELAALRPAARPEVAKFDAETDVTATDLAITASPKPLPRPRDIERIVAEARARTPEPAPSVQVASAASIAPRIPSSASVSTQATVRNAINLRRVNLIGVYGKPSNRRALVRLSNGRYQKVEVGDRIDGGRVAAIGTSELRYIKSGRNIVLEMPDG